MMNSLFLIGRLTKNPELKKTENGKSYSNITLAVQRQYKNANGEYDTDFINATVWNTFAEKLSEYSKSGDLISIKGRLETYKDKDNNYRMNIEVEKLSFLASKNITKNMDEMEER